jgi:UDP-N-acetylmuramyl pentapeptide phosphotransferase/UDP-N-acetylglucosamine-1-phosphate transferase
MKKNLRILALFVATVATKAVLAQGIPDDPDLQNIAIPVDGGIFTVVGSAVAYGVYRLKNKNK